MVKTDAGFLPMPRWMLNYAVEHELRLGGEYGSRWMEEAYVYFRDTYKPGISMIAELADGKDICGEVVMNTASFCAIQVENDDVWAVDWRLFPYE